MVFAVLCFPVRGAGVRTPGASGVVRSKYSENGSVTVSSGNADSKSAGTLNSAFIIPAGMESIGGDGDFGEGTAASPCATTICMTR